MFLKRILPITIIILAILIGVWRFQNPCEEKADLTYQNGWQDSFSVKVERRPELCGFATALAGADYIFSARPENSEDWREIMTVHYDDPVDISSKNVHILNETTAAVFMKHKYAVTTDKGINWTIWDIDKDFGLEKSTIVRSISNINFGKKGFATMNIEVVSNNGRKMDAPYITKNFGKTWETLSK